MAGTISRVSESERAQILRNNISQVLEALNDSVTSQELKDEIMDELYSMSTDEITQWASENPYHIESTFLYEDAQALSAAGYYDANARLILIAKSLGISYRNYLEEAYGDDFNMGIMLNAEKAAKRRLENIEEIVDFRNRER